MNEEKFSGLMTEVYKPSFQEHIRHMMRPGAWATHVEVIAAATYFLIPVYFCQDLPQHIAYCWDVFKPVCPAKFSRYPIQSFNQFQYLPILRLYTIKICIIHVLFVWMEPFQMNHL